MQKKKKSFLTVCKMRKDDDDVILDSTYHVS